MLRAVLLVSLNLFWLPLVYGSEEGKERQISKKYFLGSYLIFDCENQHFACVSERSFRGCQKRRQNALLDKRFHLECAPFKKFPTRKACFQEQAKQIQFPKKKLFCFNKAKE